MSSTLSAVTRLASSFGVVCLSSCSGSEISGGGENRAPVDHIVVTPARSSLVVGSAQAFIATLSDANNNVLTDRVVVWSSSAPSVATVSSAGVVSAVSESGDLSATAMIIARAEGKTGSATATVEAPSVPMLSSFTLSPATVMLGNSPTTVTAAIHVTDVSGATVGSVMLRPPLGYSAQLAKGCSFRLSAGTANDGTWSCSMTFPAGTPPGRWSLGYYRVTNNVGDEAFFFGTAAKAFGQSSGVSVLESAADVGLPALAGFAITPTSTVVGSMGGSTVFTVHATDAASGVDWVYVDVGNQYGQMSGNAARCSRVDANADRRDVTWTCTLEYSSYVLAGLYPVLSIELVDVAGNSRTYTNAELWRAGFPGMFTLTR